MPSTRCAVSIVLLTFDAAPLLPQAFRSLAALNGPAPEVVVIDNNSSDGSAALAEDASRRYGWTFHANERNTGYAEGMNLGISQTIGDLVIPLNCDAVLDPAFVAEARAAAADYPDAGALAPNVRRPAAEHTQPGDDGSVLRLRAGMRVGIVAEAPRGAIVFKANGAAPVLRRAAIQQLATWPDVFDARFQTYGEDIDLALRLWELGWTTRYVPGMRAIHERSRGAGERVWTKSGWQRRNLVRARWFNAILHSPGAYLARDLALIGLQDLALATVSALRGDLTAAADVREAWGSVRTVRKQLLHERRKGRGMSRRGFRRLTRLPKTG